MNLSVVGEIETADSFLRQLGVARDVCLTINCTGGNSLAALEIFHALEVRNVEVEIVGRCYSAGVTIAMAGRVIRIREDARVMIHRPVNHVVGDDEMLRCEAKTLGKLTEQITSIIASRTRQPREQVEQWLAPGSDFYMTAGEAVKLGFADEILPAITGGCTAMPKTVQRNPGFTDEEKLLFDFLRALGEVPTNDRARLMRELGVWATYNVKEAHG